MPALVVPARAPALVVARIHAHGRAALDEAAAAAALGAGAVLTEDPGTVTLLARESGLPVVVPVDGEVDLLAAVDAGAAAALLAAGAGVRLPPVRGIAVLAPPEAVEVAEEEVGAAAAAAAVALALGARVLVGSAVRPLRRCAEVWAAIEAAGEG